MRNEALYLTLAQVLPALLIVLVLELRGGGAAAQDDLRQARSLLQDIPDGPAVEMEGVLKEARREWLGRSVEAARRALRFGRIWLAVAWTFAIGEAACLAAPIVGVTNWFAWLVGPISLLAVAIMSACVILLPTLARKRVDI